MMTDNIPDYSQNTIYELYDLYFKAGKNLNSESYTLLLSEIRKRFNLLDESIITDDLIRELYSKYNYSGKLLNDKEEESNLAGRGHRLIAAILDGVIVGILFSMVISLFLGFDEYIKLVMENQLSSKLIFLLLGQLLFVAANVYFLWKNGQTLGKKIMRIKIVKMSDEKPVLQDSYVLRSFFPAVLTQLPFLGLIFVVLDISFIFREDKRCMHDLIAGTKVIKA